MTGVQTCALPISDNSIPLEFIGSRDTRYGSWARKLPKDEKMILEPDPDFIKSLSKPVLKLIWFDQASTSGKISLIAGNSTFVTQPKEDGTWKETTFSLLDTNFTKVEIQALDGDVIIHMVEIQR